MTTIPFNNGGPVIRDGKVVASETCCDGICCGGVWRTPKNSGECCRGVWYPDANPCPEGQIFLRWGVNDGCCGCVDEQIFDGRVNAMVDTVDVVADLCCPTCDDANNAGILLPFDDDGNVRGCLGRCCDGDNCTDTLEADCIHEWSQSRCCVEGCPKPCCTEADSGDVACQVTEQNLCTGTLDDEPCETACKGACCVEQDGELVLHENSPMTQAACEAVSGQFQGVGSTECEKCEEGLFRCRDPLTLCCCETHSSTGVGLTFYQPRRKRQPQFSDTIQVTVTGTTRSPIRVHGELVAPFAECGCELVSFTQTFLLCWDAFNIEPVPCGSSFCDLSVKVCWKQLDTDRETLNFSGCDDITVWLGNCTYDCDTTLVYTGSGHTSNASIVMYGDGTIQADGTGPLVLTMAISHGGTCSRTLTISGSSTAANSIGSIPEISGSSTVSVVKDGSGLWLLSGSNNYIGGFTLKAGTVVVTNAGGGDSVLGFSSGPAPVLGDTASDASVPARLLLEAGVRSTRVLRVPATAGAQEVVLGGYLTSATPAEFYNSSIRIGRPVTLMANSGGLTSFSTTLLNESGSGGAAADVYFGTPDGTGTVQVTGTLATSGTMNVRHGTVEVDEFGVLEAGSLEVQSGATLILRGLYDNPGFLLESATLTSSGMTIVFTGDPESGDEYVLINGSTVQNYTPTITGTTATGSYDAATATLTIT